MPVRNKTSNLFGADVDPARARGRPIVEAGEVANAADDDLGSRFLLARIPSAAILDALTTFKADTWGYATTAIGTETNTTALVNAARTAAHTPIARMGTQHGMPLWQVLGMAADPGGEIELYAHALANATGAGTMRFEIHYRFR